MIAGRYRACKHVTLICDLGETCPSFDKVIKKNSVIEELEMALATFLKFLI